MDTTRCAICEGAGELRKCGYCRRQVCESCSAQWHDWTTGPPEKRMRHTEAECRQCWDASIAAIREIVAARGVVAESYEFETAWALWRE